MIVGTGQLIAAAARWIWRVLPCIWRHDYQAKGNSIWLWCRRCNNCGPENKYR